MCTVTWRATATGLEILFNRDEQRSRPPAAPPTLSECAGMRYLCPVDTAGGGTWIGVNAGGLALCLLNHHPDPTPAPPARPESRGLLVRSALGQPAAGHVDELLRDARLARLPPFILLAFTAAGPLTRWCWDGQRLDARPLSDADLPITTSSYASASVTSRRRALYEARFGRGPAPNLAALFAYHCQFDPADGAHSVCMERPDARTVSFTRVILEPGRAGIAYSPQPPRTTALDEIPVVVVCPE